MECAVADEAVSVLVNGEPRSVPAGVTIGALLALLGMGGRRLAVAVNRSVVPRSGFDRVALAAGDRIEILEAVGGG
ncbi:MAG: sulfur carrier protein ThiS [Deltaproteobacteria bacterium]|nr:sulfur carrier protein ThiS [Deltaproteobacteria bacterium]